MRVAYVTSYDANDRSKWSGSGHAIRQSLLDQGLEVVSLGPLRTDYRWLGRLKGAIYSRALRCNYDFQREAIVGRGYARQIKAKLDCGRYDVVLCPGSIPIARLNCNQPIVIWADATFESYISHYNLAETMCRETILAGHHTERSAYERCSSIIFTSEWAAKSAISYYGVSSHKITIIPFGANFIEPPPRGLALGSLPSRQAGPCRLITIGVDWYRKGIPRSIELAKVLNGRGVETVLDIVGCDAPTGVIIPNFVNVVGFIDKRTVEGERRLSSLLLQSHFHVLLSTADATPVVFSEANAHAVPNIASDVGGISTVVINGRGGQRFSSDAPICQVADYVEAHFKDLERYVTLAQNARLEYEERLNWQVSGAAVKRHLESLTSTR